MKLLIIGHGRHGKDTCAELFQTIHGFEFSSSSLAAAKIFLYDRLKHRYSSFEECYNDRHNHRAEWYNLIDEYNTPDKSRLAKEILKVKDIYVGMRSPEELQACREENLFDLIIGVYDPIKPLEPKDSFKIDIFKESDIIIINNKTKDHLWKVIDKIL